MIKNLLIPILMFGLFWSCSESELITPGDEYLPNQMTEGHYSVVMDGVLWDFSNATNAVDGSSTSQVNGGNQTGGTISIGISNHLGVGTYTQSNGATISINTGNGILTNSNSSGPLPFELKITEAVNGKVSGTFTGSVYNSTTGETHTLTNGIFVKIHFDVDENPGIVFKAMFDGQLFDFSVNAKAEGIQTAALISGNSTTQNNQLSITIPGGISQNTFTEADGVVIKVNLGSSPVDIYSNYDASTDTYLPASVTITGIGIGENGWVTGTFSGKIAKFVNGQPTGQINITNGQIVVPILLP